MIQKFSEYLVLREQEGTEPSAVQDLSQRPQSDVTSEPETQLKRPTPVIKPKWKMTKSDIIKFWQSLPVGLPIAMHPIEADHEGSTFSEDAIRITGSTEFIKSVLCRLKEFLNYESDKTKLNISFRETSSPSLEQEGLAKTSYVFYLQTKERG